MIIGSGVPVGIPVDVDRDTAARAAHRELAHPDYAAARPSPLARAWDWLTDHLAALFEHAAQRSPDGHLGLIALGVLLALLIVTVRLRLGRVARTASAARELFDEVQLTAADHRRAADAYAADGDRARALRERLRAVVRELEERELLAPRPGRTATELAAEAARVLPGHADGLRRAAEEFAEVWYGGRPATPAMDDRVRMLDAAARAAGCGSGAARAGSTGPR